MSSLPHRFTITVDGKHIAKPEQKNEEMFQAESGNEPAVFEIKDDRLVCGEWTLGRWVVENKSYLAKPVMWRKNEEASQELQPVEVKVGATGPEITFGDAPGMAIHDGKLVAPHQQDECQTVEIRAED
ncbi:uncharacterized protein B0J16DRAFT_404130 [Fusarium flagelliforme]|uniref:Uncharacterized protein n=1 Tax=Fusarium flagelliforme TaxID=2675880 RepID=A0A395MDT5_9HYPO|nr:uncharacterized protein B0J16DRAFT_404130 [Fusarium flagelliforme]KAH7174455.1 hypothetical protein B0J16DRAFT_404130 [Fusarium flagelliforme]RFN46014.1 hypothetical protein FIE12Z_9765 [Fusarium flagelliforme]